MVKRLIYLFCLVIILFGIAYLLIKEESRNPTDFYLDGETTFFLRFTPQSPSYLNGPMIQTLNVEVSNLISHGSVLKTYLGSVRQELVPDTLDHIFTATALRKNETNQLSINFSSTQEIQCLPNIHYNEKTSLNSVPLKCNYNLGFIFSDSITGKELWKLHLRDSSVKIRAVGYAGKIFELPERDINKDLSTSGYFYKDSLWTIAGPLYFLDVQGYGFSVNSKHELGKIELLPRIDFRARTNPYNFNIWISKISLGMFHGNLFVSGKKIELGNSSINIDKMEEVGQLNVTALPQKLHIKLKGTSENLIVDNENLVETFGGRLARDNPILISLCFAITSGLIISLVVTKGKSLQTWIFQDRRAS